MNVWCPHHHRFVLSFLSCKEPSPIFSPWNNIYFCIDSGRNLIWLRHMGIVAIFHEIQQNSFAANVDLQDSFWSTFRCTAQHTLLSSVGGQPSEPPWTQASGCHFLLMLSLENITSMARTSWLLSLQELAMILKSTQYLKHWRGKKKSQFENEFV